MTTSTPINKTAPQIASLLATTDRIVLTGFMGAGKTSVGRLLAQTLGWAFLDLDAHLEARAQTTIPALFALHGEPHFRRLESQALASALSLAKTVIALGGGTPEQITNRLLLEQTPRTTIIFLDAPFPTLYDRCMLDAVTTGAERPVLASPEEAEARFRARQPDYRRLATLTLPTAALSPSEVAKAICDVLIP